MQVWVGLSFGRSVFDAVRSENARLNAEMPTASCRYPERVQMSNTPIAKNSHLSTVDFAIKNNLPTLENIRIESQGSFIFEF